MKAAPSDIDVLIRGETGTGKGVVAEIIHKMSKRREKSMNHIDVSSLPETLLESELFGHEKGAFTGAIKQKKGQLELAHGGTAFVDEIGNVPFHLQAKLLNVLEKKRFYRVGGTKIVEVDFRLICATNKNLEEMMTKEEFMPDLYFRINRLHIHLLPLRDSPGDIATLATHFLDLYCKKHGKGPIKLDQELEDVLTKHPWPGNVRDLEAAVERAVVLSENGKVDIDRLRTELSKSPTGEIGSSTSSFTKLGSEIKAKKVAWALKQSGGNKAAAARLLGVQRKTIYSYLK